MTQEYTMLIEAADNGMIVRDDDGVEVIEDEHNVDDADRANLKARLGERFLCEIENYMNQYSENIAEVTIKIKNKNGERTEEE